MLLDQGGLTPGPVLMSVACAVCFTPLALFVLRRVPGHPLGRLMLLSGVSATLATLAVCWSAYTGAAWVSQWLWWPPIAVIPAMLLIFPDGHLPSPRWRGLAVGLLGCAAVAAAALALGALVAPRTLLSTVGEPLSHAARLSVQVALVAIGGVLVATVGVLAALIRRWRAAATLERRQLACLVPVAGLLVVGVVMDTVGVPGGWVLAVVALPLGFTFAILQFRLFDLDLYINRGLVWIVLTALAVLIFAVTVTGFDRLFGADRSTSATIVAATVLAAGLLPAERFVQRWLNQLIFGRRGDPYGVLMRVGRHIEAVRDPLEVLPRFTATLVETMRVPYVAIALPASPGVEAIRVEHGRRTGQEPQRFAMVAHGVAVGDLLVETRRPGARFSAAEDRLLQGLAGQAAVAAEACRATMDLQRARERLVLAREEERRRLRRDLHDGVASTLVGARMLTAAALIALPPDGAAPDLLNTLAEDLANCTDEVRDLIDGLRPAVLDGGLTAALEDVIRRVSGSLTAELSTYGDLGNLPAAVEVVALRTVTEALTNVVKHAQSSWAGVELVRDDDTLTLTVRDTGVGFVACAASTDTRGGVGVVSIRSRVEEVGGHFSIVNMSPGTCIVAQLPAPADRKQVHPSHLVPVS
jgi:signal transduction histidine kinase